LSDACLGLRVPATATGHGHAPEGRGREAF
jgi:hypothetical protein